MIERCTKKRMLVSIIILIGLSIVIVLLEHHFTKSPVHHSQANISGQESNHPSVDEGHCWRVENFTVVDDCHPCTDFEKNSKSNTLCEATGYKEKIKCHNSGIVYRSCDRVLWLEERRFWTLEIVSLVLLLLSSSFVIWRQRLLEHQAMQKIQRQINFN